MSRATMSGLARTIRETHSIAGSDRFHSSSGVGMAARFLRMYSVSVATRSTMLVAFTLYRFSHLALARRGLHFVLCLYLTLMLVHAATGASALGWQPPDALVTFLHLPDRLLALIS